MEGKRFLQTLHIENLLSYGSSNQEIELQPLNVLIGPNGSGKSNIIEAIALLRATPGDFTQPIRDGGGISEWLWKGMKGTPTAAIRTTVTYPDGVQPLRYRLDFTMIGQRLALIDEAVENARPDVHYNDAYFFYRYQHGRPALNVRTRTDAQAGTSQDRVQRSLRREDLNPEQSVLSQRKDPDQYPELTYLGNQFARISIYSDWNFGRYTAPRMPQKADMPENFLLDDASNLALVLNNLEHLAGDTNQLISEQLQRFSDTFIKVSPRIQGGTVQTFLHERGLQQSVPATRLSDGTLRYLCLLAILLHPTPPPLICIEEPELGLHPDIIPTIAELLKEASQRTQIIVTTHSDALVSALSDVPETVIVCERDENGSKLQRLNVEQLQLWLEKYTLGDLWRMGEIGGNR